MGLCQDRREDWRWTKWSVCRASSRCFTLSGTGRALAEQGLLHTPSPVPCFHAKLGAGRAKVVTSTLCPPALVPEGDSHRRDQIACTRRSSLHLM